MDKLAVYISHADAKEDRIIADELVTALRASGFYVIDMGPNSSWNRDLKDQILKRNALVVLLSLQSVGSPWVNWISAEIAPYQHWNELHSNVQIIPILIEPCEIPPILQMGRGLDAMHWPIDEVADQLVERLKAWRSVRRKPQRPKYRIREDRSTKSEQLQFTAFHPRVVRVETWYTLLVYTHISSALRAIREDAPKFKEEMGEIHHEISHLAIQPVARGTQITIVPSLKGVRFNPDLLSINWTEDWQRANFRFQASKDRAGTAGNGEISFFSGPLLIATLRMAMLFDELDRMPSTAGLDRTSSASSTTNMYHQIFPSYSRRDKAVVVACRNAYKALGMTVNMDVDALRSGQRFDKALMALIDSSDVFQLFWSKASAESTYVQKEWQHALACSKGEGFIRPVYWVEPVITPPPELADLHFAFVPLPKM